VITEVFADTPAIHNDYEENTSSSSESTLVGTSTVVTIQETCAVWTGGGIIIPRLEGGTRKHITKPVLDTTISIPTAVTTPPSRSSMNDVYNSKKRSSSEVLDEKELPAKVIKLSTPQDSPVPSPVSTTTTTEDDDRVPPEGWIKAFSSKQNKAYWYNVTTKKSVWTFPTN
jgi:hypothetical protein